MSYNPNTVKSQHELTGTITDISTRETDREFWEYYNVVLQEKGWTLTFSHVTEKELKDD